MNTTPEFTSSEQSTVLSTLPNTPYRMRQLLLIGQLQESVSHEVMNNLTKAMMGMDSGELDLTRRSIYQSASLLQELQQLGSHQFQDGARCLPLNKIASNALTLAKSLLKENQIPFIEVVKNCPEVEVRSQAVLMKFIELLLISAEALKRSLNRSLTLTTDGNPRMAWTTIEVAGSNVDFQFLESRDLHFIGNLLEIDKGTLSFEKNPLGFKFIINYPRFSRTV